MKQAGFAAVDARFASVEAQFASVDAKFAAAKAAADRRHTEFMKWMFGFWVGSLLALVAALYGPAQIVR